MTSKLNSDKTVAVALDYEWQRLDSCPRGAKVQLLTKHGIAIYGQFREGDKDYIGWAPVPRRPDWMNQ